MKKEEKVMDVMTVFPLPVLLGYSPLVVKKM
jgi:hypothetical protein